MFRIKHMASLKWRLFDNGRDLGTDYESLDEAKQGMMLLIKPEAYDFDGQGKEVKKATRS